MNKENVIKFLKEEWFWVLVILLIIIISIIASSNLANDLQYIEENGLKSIVEPIWNGRSG